MSLIYQPHIYEKILSTPYSSGLRSAKIITGYASSSFIYHVIHEFPELKLEITIGMARQNGISKWDHIEYNRIASTTNRLTVNYYIGKKPIHIKGLYWESPKRDIAFAGSSNFSWNGYRDFLELMTAVPTEELVVAFPENDIISCNNPDIDDMNIIVDSITSQQPKNLKDIALTKEVVHVPLFSEKQQRMHDRSGLNWGQRPEYSREPNQAYIPVPKSIHDQHPDFFPPKDQEFTLLTDDGESFVCVMAQDNRKAIETRYDNSIIGRYFRKRLNVELGNYVSLDDLERYGRKSLSIYKIGCDLFYSDYSV
jgi:hypothetical protein